MDFETPAAQIEARASCRYDPGMIDRRLELLRKSEQTPEVICEIEFLEKLKAE